MSIGFERAKKSFLEFLRSQGKALNTVKNYASDLEQLERFCEKNKVLLHEISYSTLEAYSKELAATHKTNSCRRKLMTAKMFLRNVSSKIDLQGLNDSVLKLIPPEKEERTPKVISRDVLSQILEAQKASDVEGAEQSHTINIALRNQALTLLLADTGMLVTEALSLKQNDVRFDLFGATIFIHGKRARTTKVNEATAHALKSLIEKLPNATWIFYGYSRSSRNAEKMTSRGVEILFQGWNKKHRAILKGKVLHPRSLRHLFIVEKLAQGKTQREIMDIMGLRTTYAFRVYQPFIEQWAKKTQLQQQIKSHPAS